ncbi:MAG: hypothetical protein U0169_11125 [Polyangiaceae bacterium]
MSHDDEFERMDATMRALLRRAAPGDAALPDGAKERAWTRLEDVLPRPTPPVPPKGGGITPWIWAATFVVGIGAGVVIDRAFAVDRTRIVYVDRPVAVPAEVAPTSGRPVPFRPEPSAAPLPPSPRASPTPRDSADTLPAERGLLEEARRAFAVGDPERALRLTDEHATRYPDGHLAEEREALAIRSMVASGRRGAATTRADRFRARHPDSIMAPVIDDALRGGD